MFSIYLLYTIAVYLIMQQINWGIIGCGNVTEIKSGPAFNKVPGSKLVAVMRRDESKAKDYALRHNVPKWYNDASQLINDNEVNAVYVATPPSSHEEYVLAAIRSGKPVYVEKPMSMDADSARRMADTAEKLNIRITVAHYRRQLPLFKKIQELLLQNAIGKIDNVSIYYSQPFDAKGFEPGPDNWRLDPTVSGGGIFHDLAPHQLDLMYFFFGKPLTMCGISLNKGGHYAADDYVTGFTLFENKIVLNATWNFSASSFTDECVITGSHGVMRFPFFKMDKLLFERGGSVDEIVCEVPTHVQQPMIHQVVNYFSGKISENPCSAREGVDVMSMIDAFTGKRTY